MNAKLLALPIDALFKLQQEVKEACERRRHEVYRVGRLVKFDDKAGMSVIAKITKIGPKNLYCHVLDAAGRPLPKFERGATWRCAPGYVEPVFGNPFAKPAPAPLRTGNDRPMAAGAGAF